MKINLNTMYKLCSISPSGIAHACDKGTKVKEGDKAGYIDRGVWVAKEKASGKSFLVHRIIWELANGPIPSGLHVLHIDGNKLNNDIENLYLSSHKDMMFMLATEQNKDNPNHRIADNGHGYHRVRYYVGGHRLTKSFKDLEKARAFRDFIKSRGQ